ncbi:RNA helicase [Malassezia psittaci]|uniref:ATP-dependent RNA helicase n=1 Tax=Malassezia psittaci TaxID=1821823 RepID=A0AAF0FC41_9BASI|nr:RNA helicase [Malassezia psittaci]
MAASVQGRKASSSLASSQKTKAKQRYLKAKKNRRKAKKSAGPKPFGEGKVHGELKEKKKQRKKQKSSKDQGKTPTNAGTDSSGDSDHSESSDSEASDTDSSETESEASTSSSNRSVDSSEKPAKDSKTSVIDTAPADQPEQPGDSVGIHNPSLSNSSPTDLRPANPDADETDSSDQDEHLPFLYRFPRPRQTNLSDPHQLASLGLPEGLKRPTLVNASETQSFDTHDSTNNDPHKISFSPSVKRQLLRLGINEWFAVQASVIPLLLDPSRYNHLSMPYQPPRDLCVSAPTGSGKTLAYIVPIVEVLRSRIIMQLRALILVPTRDLAIQVGEMFFAIGKGSGLHAAVITGNHSFRHEQAQIVSGSANGYSSNVDVLIATPGRLVDHIRDTPGFTLEHLRFLVIDEADRLLTQSFQQWVSNIQEALEPKPSHCKQVTSAPASLATELPVWACDDLDSPVPSVQKLLFSATLTRDPAKIGLLRLRNPHYVHVRDDVHDEQIQLDRYALPAGLTEHMIITEPSNKVLCLLYLFHSHLSVRRALCFTKSVDSANRLVRLLTFFQARFAPSSPLSIQNYSSDLTRAARTQILRQFEHGKIDVLVCSDLISRGMDIPDVRTVISYDVPVDMAKYVHRVGRTARAGRTGDAYSLVEEQEVYHFKNMLREANHLEQVETIKIRPSDYEPYKALSELATVYSQQHKH